MVSTERTSQVHDLLVPASERRTLYPFKDAFVDDYIQVSEIHKVNYEISGNKDGQPVLILHGGPGGGMSDGYRGFFDPEFYKVVQFSQRGSGKSTPSACLEDNTTWRLVEDIEKIRELLKIEKWHTVFGGSWGSTLSLVYAIKHPERVSRLVLRGIFMVRRSEIQFFYQEGSSWIFPDEHEKLKNLLPPAERQDILQNYYRRLTSNDEETKLKFAQTWTTYEMATSYLFQDRQKIEKGEDPEFAQQFARIETHYFVNGAFFDSDEWILENAHKIAHIPTIIVHGRYDVVCPLKSAWDLQKKLNHSQLYITPDAGHSCMEKGTIDFLVKATDHFKTN